MMKMNQLSAIAPGEVRVILWDIDGTLLRSTRAGAFREYIVPAVASVFGTAGRLDELRHVSGMTDLQIVAEALRDEGITPERIRERVAELRTRFMIEMRRVMAAHTAQNPLFQSLSGVPQILERVASHPRYLSSLLTGNLEPAAYLKLQLVGLEHFFQLPGAFGDDSHDRRDLPALAAARLNVHLKLDLRPTQFIVIGDTPNDIACARHFGARAVAVCTGRFDSRESLAAHHPDAMLDDLSDSSLVLQTLDEL